MKGVKGTCPLENKEVFKVKKFLISACVVVAAVLMSVTSVQAVEILFESRITRQVSRGVTYEENRMMTSRGMLDVHVLTIDIHEPYVTLAPVISMDSLGFKDTALNLLRNAGAVAGINADYFGLAGTHSVHFGLSANDGRITAINPNINAPNAESLYATFLLDMYNNAFFTYMQGRVRFLVNGVQLFDISA